MPIFITNMNKIAFWFFSLWVITFPITIFIVYTLVTEFLDLIFNTRKINNLLKHSDLFNSELFEKQYQIDKEKQSKLNQSNLMELDRQISHIRLKKYNGIWSKTLNRTEKEKILAAKEITDIFKIR